MRAPRYVLPGQSVNIDIKVETYYYPLDKISVYLETRDQNFENDFLNSSFSSEINIEELKPYSSFVGKLPITIPPEGNDQEIYVSLVLHQSAQLQIINGDNLILTINPLSAILSSLVQILVSPWINVFLPSLVILLWFLLSFSRNSNNRPNYLNEFIELGGLICVLVGLVSALFFGWIWVFISIAGLSVLYLSGCLINLDPNKNSSFSVFVNTIRTSDKRALLPKTIGQSFATGIILGALIVVSLSAFPNQRMFINISSLFKSIIGSLVQGMTAIESNGFLAGTLFCLLVTILVDKWLGFGISLGLAVSYPWCLIISNRANDIKNTFLGHSTWFLMLGFLILGIPSIYSFIKSKHAPKKTTLMRK